MGLIVDLRGDILICTILVSKRGKVSENRIGFLMVDRLLSLKCEGQAQSEDIDIKSFRRKL